MSEPSSIDSWRILQALGSYAAGGPEVVQAKFSRQASINAGQRIGLLALFDEDGNPFLVRQASLGSIPVLTGVAIGLTTTMTTLAASWWCLDPARWPTPPAGGTLQYRLVVTTYQGTNADIMSAQMYDTVGAATLFTAPTATKVAGSDTTQIVSSWQTFPATIKGGYIQARNQTGARGTVVSAFIEVRIA